MEIIKERFVEQAFSIFLAIVVNNNGQMAVEFTGVYQIPIYKVFENKIEVIVVNPY